MSRRFATRSRSGLSLLEVVLALAILAGSFAILTQLVSSGIRAAANARDLTRAQIHAETIVSEIAAGVIPAASMPQTELEPGWLASVDVLSTTQDGVLQVVVAVERNTNHARGVRYELSRWIRDPSIPLPVDETMVEDSGSSGSSASGAEGGGA